MTLKTPYNLQYGVKFRKRCLLRVSTECCHKMYIFYSAPEIEPHGAVVRHETVNETLWIWSAIFISVFSILIKKKCDITNLGSVSGY